MRSWYPIPVQKLDRLALLGEHKEVHAIGSILHNKKKGYSHHPEVLRWKNHTDILQRRHDELASELIKRDYNHRSPWKYPTIISTYPVPFWEPLSIMTQKLKNKIISRKSLSY